MIRTAILGCGFSARTFHIPFIQASPEFELVAVSTSQVEQAALDFPGVEIYANAPGLLAESDVQLVIVTAPNTVHFDLARQALVQGMHVVVDKPFVTTVAQGKQLLTEADARNLVLSVYHNRRWDGDFLTLKNLIERGEVGEVRYLESHIDRFRPEVRQRWRELPGEGAGIWFDLGPHLLDQALCLFGMPEALTARCLKLREHSSVADYFHVQLHYQGCEVVLHASPFSAGPNPRFQLQGSDGSYVKYGMDPQEDRLRAGEIPNQPNWGAEEAGAHGYLYREDGKVEVPTATGGYQHYFGSLANAIRGSGPVPVTAQEAIDVIRLILLAEQSSSLGRTVLVS